MFNNRWKRHAPRMVGIDIGSHDIKAIALTKSDIGYKIVNIVCVSIPKTLHIHQDNLNGETLQQSLIQLSKLLPKNIKYAAVAVCGSAVMTKKVFIDAMLPDDEMEAQIEIEASNLIPYPLEEVSLDFEIIGQNKADPLKNDVLLSACRTENIDILVDALAAINLEAKVVDIEGYALGRSAELIFKQLPNLENKVICLVDIGARKTTFSIVKSGETALVREQDIGGEQLTLSIQSYYALDYKDAERGKLNPQDLPENYLSDLLKPFQMQLLQQIKRTLQMYSAAHEQHRFDYIFLSGGTALLDGLTKLLTNELSIPTMLANPLQSALTLDEETQVNLKTEISKYMVACGLALRSKA